MYSIKLGSDNAFPIFMLHGWGKSSGNLLPLGEILANYYQVHLFDLPGFGKSPVPDSIWGTKEYADCILDYMDKQGIKSAHFLGHSFGGRVSIQFSSRHPDRIGKLILIGVPGLKRSRTPAQLLRIKTISFSGKLLKKIDQLFKTDLFKRKFAAKFGSPDYLNAGEMRPIFVKTVNEDYTDRIPLIKAPTLLLWGGNDTEVPVEVAERMGRLIHGSKLEVLEGRGHEPYQGIGTQLCGQYILEFLS